jgi:PAS domain S-box-containing protein
MLLFLSTAVPASATEKLKLIVGGDHENPPYEFLENGQPTGFNIELMRAVAETIGADVEFRLGPWGKVRKELEQGKIDALAGMYYSEERNKVIDFSLPHTMVSAGLFVRQDSPIHSIDDIMGKEIIVQKGDVIDDYLREKGITSRIVEVTDPADELRLLASGRHDSALMPSRFQGEYLKRSLGLDNIRVIGTNLPQFRYCFAVRKGNSALRYRLDEGLNILKVNGKYQKIYERWFGIYVKKDLWRTIRYYVWSLLLIATLLAVNFIWSWSLRRQVRMRTAELRERDENLRFTQYAIDKSIDQAFWMTKDARLFYVNEAACRILGYTREELLKLSIPDIDPIYQPEKFAEHWRDIQENGYATFETLHRAKDGRVYPVEIRANYVVFDGKEYNCAFATDISERKRMEEDLRHAYDDLEKRVRERTTELAETVDALKASEERLQRKRKLLEFLNSTLEERVRGEVTKNREKDVMLIQQNRQAALGEILDHIAHQWKQPLYTISLITYLLKENDSLKKEEINETTDKILAQVDHMSQTLNDFREFYRPDKEKLVFLIKESIDRALTFIMPALQFESIEVETRVDPGLSASGYPKEFAQVILNLVSNARDAFKEKKVEKPRLIIRGFAEDNMAVVTVTDNAGGICEATIANIFDLNFTTKELSGGTGIGLYMSKNIIERDMRGKLTAGNVADGAQFSIRLGTADSWNE